jgi:hypothetical protein
MIIGYPDIYEDDGEEPQQQEESNQSYSEKELNNRSSFDENN